MGEKQATEMTPERLAEIEKALECRCEEHGDSYGSDSSGWKKWYNACPEHGEGGLQLLAVPVGATRELLAALQEAWQTMDEVAEEMEETRPDGIWNREDLMECANRLRRR